MTARGYRLAVEAWCEQHKCTATYVRWSHSRAEVCIEAPAGHNFEHDIHERIFEADTLRAAWYFAWQCCVRDDYHKHIHKCADATPCCSWSPEQQACEWWGLDENYEWTTQKTCA